MYLVRGRVVEPWPLIHCQEGVVAAWHSLGKTGLAVPRTFLLPFGRLVALPN